ncbi:hypothetical protein [Mycobacterium riyadhense]|uniref:hypothetical protein n=1 Tax=Mycobacterium riyadhense TaxID=486698 RepID=UPI0019506643|nr:hypothetical protein [Mycobacterium riyadhense]
MTLVQTLYTRDRIIQVSDRRLTWPDGTVFDDDYTKLVCWNQTFSVAFTGIARVDRRLRKSTSEWIAEMLSDYLIFENGVRALCADAQDRVRRLNWDDKRLAIVIAGFDGRDVPLVAQIANFDTSTGVADDPDLFHIRSGLIRPGNLTGTHFVGAAMKGLEYKLFTRYVPRVLRKDKANGHNRAIKLLVENQRRVHKQMNRVGEDAQAVTIPCRRMANGIVMSNLDGTDIPVHSTSFVYFDKHGFRYRQLGPLMAHNGTVIDQVIGTADEENPDNQSMSIRFVKVPNPPTPRAITGSRR